MSLSATQPVTEKMGNGCENVTLSIVNKYRKEGPTQKFRPRTPRRGPTEETEERREVTRKKEMSCVKVGDEHIPWKNRAWFPSCLAHF